MSRITVLGGTGYAGGAIVREAASRGHDVASYSRAVPGHSDRVPGVRYIAGSVSDEALLEQAVTEAEVVVSALSPRGELDGKLVAVERRLALLARDRGTRLAVVGGFSALRLEENGPRMAEGDGLPPEFASEARQMYEVLLDLLEMPESLHWVYFSPAMKFGSFAPGTALGRYRVGGEVALLETDGTSALSGADFALAVVDHLESVAPRRGQVGFAY